MSILAASGEGEVLNPLLPVGYDIAWTAIVAFAVIAAVVAFISIYRQRQQMSGLERAIWVATCLFIGIIGPIAWLAIGRRKAREGPGERVQSMRA
jgi:hypothetical protein